ncbi:MAG: hypothetical protein Q4C41_03220 [Eggerthellaceae bacterium]|nr:hypothetical protein [Eggerthellaceae bacterium]
MPYNDYGYRYPGGHSVIESTWRNDGENLRYASAAKRKKAKQRATVTAAPGGINYDSLRKGSRVSHGTLGKGTVVAVEPSRVSILWDKDGVERFLKRSTATKNLRLEGSVRALDKAQDAPKTDETAKRPGQTSASQKQKKSSCGMTKEALIGCHVRDRRNRLGIILTIDESKMTIRFEQNGCKERLAYPQSFEDGRIVVLREARIEFALRRQREACEQVKNLIRSSKEQRKNEGG